MHAQYPKILPWLAKKAGVSLQRAEELWGDALRYSARNSELVESPAYWKLAFDRLDELLAAESRKLGAMPFGFGPVVRLPARLWLHHLTTQQAMLSIAANSASYWWRRRA